MTIRLAIPDADGHQSVATAAWETDYPDILSRETAEDGVRDWYAPEQLESELVESQTLLLVAEREEHVVGFAHATWHETDQEGYILRLYVHPDYRREGIDRHRSNRLRGTVRAMSAGSTQWSARRTNREPSSTRDSDSNSPTRAHRNRRRTLP